MFHAYRSLSADSISAVDSSVLRRVDRRTYFKLLLQHVEHLQCGGDEAFWVEVKWRYMNQCSTVTPVPPIDSTGKLSLRSSSQGSCCSH